MRRARASLALVCLLAGLPAAGAPAEVPAHVAERIARRSLEDARALVREGRLEHAEFVLRRGIEAAPGHARRHRTLAEVLAAEGRGEEATRERARADSLEPPPGPLPQGPAGLPTAGLVVVLVPPEPDPAHPTSPLN